MLWRGRGKPAWRGLETGLTGGPGNGAGKRGQWPQTAEMTRNGQIRDTFWMAAHEFTDGLGAGIRKKNTSKSQRSF